MPHEGLNDRPRPGKRECDAGAGQNRGEDDATGHTAGPRVPVSTSFHEPQEADHVTSSAEQQVVAEQRAAGVNGTRRAAPPTVPARPGSPTPLGARFRVGPDGVAGTNFALWAAGA